MKSLLGPELFSCTHSSLTPWPLGWNKLLCAGSRFLASSLAPTQPRAGVKGVAHHLCARAGSFLEKLQPPTAPGAETHREPWGTKRTPHTAEHVLQRAVIPCPLILLLSGGP